MERTFIAIKNDGVQRGLVGEIISRFERKGFRLVALKFLTPSTALAEEHYAEHREKKFFPGLVSFFTSGPLVAMVWEGNKVISAARTLIGETNPLTSAPGTIRGDFAIDIGRNVIHGSADGPSAEREIKLWFRPEEIQTWTPTREQHIYEQK